MGYTRRLEDKLRLLCAKAVMAKEHADASGSVSGLQAALRAHAQRVREFGELALAGERPKVQSPTDAKLRSRAWPLRSLLRAEVVAMDKD